MLKMDEKVVTQKTNQNDFGSSFRSENDIAVLINVVT